MSKDIKVDITISVNIGDQLITLDRENAIALYNQLGSKLGIGDDTSYRLGNVRPSDWKFFSDKEIKKQLDEFHDSQVCVSSQPRFRRI